jgi:hypothetical protein
LDKDVKLTFFLVPVSSTAGFKAHFSEEEYLPGSAPCGTTSSNCEPVSTRSMAVTITTTTGSQATNQATPQISFK